MALSHQLVKQGWLYFPARVVQTLLLDGVCCAIDRHRHATRHWAQPQQHPQHQAQHVEPSAPAGALAALPPSSLEQRRSFGLAIARKLEGREYHLRNDVVQQHFEGLADYLIKVVPKWVKFAVAGPAQSNDTYNEVTLYTTPEGLLPLCRWGRWLRYGIQLVAGLAAADAAGRKSKVLHCSCTGPLKLCQ